MLKKRSSKYFLFMSKHVNVISKNSMCFKSLERRHKSEDKNPQYGTLQAIFQLNN